MEGTVNPECEADLWGPVTTFRRFEEIEDGRMIAGRMNCLRKSRVKGKKSKLETRNSQLETGN